MAKRALLIGINRYRIPGADLRGCVNDVKNIKGALTRYYGFADKDITIVTDFDATKKRIQREIEKLVRRARRGDVLLLHYSGHGSNVPDNDGDEADRRDEILCPTDLDWKDPLTDDWLRRTFDGLPAGVNLTVIMDCCHSGTITRAIEPPDVPSKERFLPSPWDLVAVESGRRLSGVVRGGRRDLLRRARRSQDVVFVDIPEILISGCRDTQTSADAYIGGSFNGALTYHLVAAIKEKKGQLTYRELHARTIELLRQGKFSQVPQLEGRKQVLDRPFLSPLE
ncbi:MAG TPA: caspase family protein [Blastocatellia bacterium]|nr:caspase family protein [Blastocatellia bacterium]